MTEDSLWDGMPEQTQLELESARVRKRSDKGDYLYRAGDTPQGIYLLVSGLVGLVTLSSSGKEHLVRLFKGGQYFGHRSLFANEPYHASSHALEPVECDFLPKNLILSISKSHPEFGLKVAEKLAKELRRAELWLGSMTDRQVGERIAEALLYLKTAYPEHLWTRREIAEFCGSTTPTIIRTLAQFEEQGFISQEGRTITILNRDALLAKADVK